MKGPTTLSMFTMESSLLHHHAAENVTFEIDIRKLTLKLSRGKKYWLVVK